MTKVYAPIGYSGCGKGTQTKLLANVIFKDGLDRGDMRDILVFSSGDEGRKFSNKPGYTNEKIKEVLEEGGFFPDFFTMGLWSHFLTTAYRGREDIIVDGVPRTMKQAEILDETFSFYGIQDVCIIFIDVSRECATKWMLARGRKFDTPDNIKSRLDLYEQEVSLVVEYYKNHGSYTFISINGEQSIEKVHQSIVEKIDW